MVALKLYHFGLVRVTDDGLVSAYLMLEIGFGFRFIAVKLESRERLVAIAKVNDLLGSVDEDLFGTYTRKRCITSILNFYRFIGWCLCVLVS